MKTVVRGRVRIGAKMRGAANITGDGNRGQRRRRGIFDFSNRPFYGSLGGHPPAVAIVSVDAYG